LVTVFPHLGLRGRYPAILDHERYGEQARKLFVDAQDLLEKIIKGKLLTARAVYGIFPANAVGDDVEVYSDDSRTRVLTTFHFLRQQMAKKRVNRTSRWPILSLRKTRGIHCQTTSVLSR
jgi:cobalamin-dependent methionine synthase I